MPKSPSILRVFTWSAGKGRSGSSPCWYSVVQSPSKGEGPASSTGLLKTSWPLISMYSSPVIRCCYSICFPSTEVFMDSVCWGRVAPLLWWCETWAFPGGGEWMLEDWWQMLMVFILSIFLLGQIVMWRSHVLGCWRRSRKRVMLFNGWQWGKDRVEPLHLEQKTARCDVGWLHRNLF